MSAFFLVCAALGGGVLALQLVLGLLGVIDAGGHADVGGGDVEVHGGDHAFAHVAAEGLNLLSVRAVSAGVAFFGLGGLAGVATGLGLLAAAPLALVVGGAALVGTAAVTRWMNRLEDDGSVSIHGAIGSTGTVYLTIPGERQGAGKILLTLQNRTVEYQAVTSQDALPTGAAVMVVDVVGPDTVDVVLDPTTKELSDAAR